MKQLYYVIILLFGIGIAGFAQTATVKGVVTDSSQAINSRADVVITNLDTGLRREVHTNETGGYALTLLPVGRYKVEASSKGFAVQSLPEIKLDVDQVVRLDFTLKPGALAETVEVSATAALLDSDAASVGQVISNKQIVEMPLNGRNYLSLASIAAGT